MQGSWASKDGRVAGRPKEQRWEGEISRWGESKCLCGPMCGQVAKNMNFDHNHRDAAIAVTTIRSVLS